MRRESTAELGTTEVNRRLLFVAAAGACVGIGGIGISTIIPAALPAIAAVLGFVLMVNALSFMPARDPDLRWLVPEVLRIPGPLIWGGLIAFDIASGSIVLIPAEMMTTHFGTYVLVVAGSIGAIVFAFDLLAISISWNLGKAKENSNISAEGP
jgi:hypothetical protein